MRTIKFRGRLINYCGQYHYDENNNYVMNTIGNWITGSLIDYGQSETQYKKGYYIFEDQNLNKLFKVFDESVGQYTGIKDINGVEIYEGDIIKEDIYIDGLHSEYTSVVEYDEINPAFVLRRKIDMTKHKEMNETLYFKYEYLLGQHDWGHIKVIGNIYDNPELLKEKK